MALRCAAGDETGELFDGVLAIDPDMQESDCFITRLFAGLDSSSSADVMKGLLTISSSCDTMHEWLVLHQHMIECVDKVKADFSPLVRQGQDLSAPFEGVHTGADSPFVGFLRDAIERVRDRAVRVPRQRRESTHARRDPHDAPRRGSASGRSSPMKPSRSSPGPTTSA